MIRIFLVAPALALRTGLRTIFTSDDMVEVVAEAAAPAELQRYPSQPDVLVVSDDEITFKELDQAFLAEGAVAVLLLVSADFDIASFLSRRPDLSISHLSAWGVLPLESTAEELLAAVHALHEGLLVSTPGIVEPLLFELLENTQRELEPLVEKLTERELEVLQLIAQGLANKQIAVELSISEHTVKFHVSAIYAKLGATSRTEAVRLGVLRGLVIL